MVTQILCRAVAALAENPKFHLKKIFQPGDIEVRSDHRILRLSWMSRIIWPLRFIALNGF